MNPGEAFYWLSWSLQAENSKQDSDGRHVPEAGHLKHSRQEETVQLCSSGSERLRKKHKLGKGEVTRNMLSFGDEIDEEDASGDMRAGCQSTLGAVTAKR